MTSDKNEIHSAADILKDMTVKGAIFDLDGTLLDSMFIWDTMGEDYLRHLGIAPKPGLNERFRTLSIMQAVEHYQTEYGLKGTSQEIIDHVNSYVGELYSGAVELKAGVLPLLELFKAHGIAMCVATATDRDIAKSALQHNGILEYFSEILTCTDVGFGKDSPVIFEKSLELLGTQKSETLVFEDALHAIATAKAAGFIVVGVFDSHCAHHQEKIKFLADYYLPSF
ncbi:MAG: HAD family phosphatase [Oscillospiraceae bacterium]